MPTTAKHSLRGTDLADLELPSGTRDPRLRDAHPEEAFSRIAEAPLIHNNSVRLLKDAAENYPAWLDAIATAERYIHFESYIIHEDDQGHLFADAFIKKAQDGVTVRLIYDWVGGLGNTSRKFWNKLRTGGVDVRCYNPFDFTRPLGWITRDHRKMLVVDGKVAFVTGLCIGRMWIGDPDKGIAPWRDTGVEIRGGSVREVDLAFADVWDDLGPAIPIEANGNDPDAGNVSMRVVASKPGNARTYRLDQLIGAMSRETLWLTDAYFAGSAAYVETLRSAAMDGVDVRLLLPASTDIAVMQTISRSGYRGLLEAGVKIYEWDGPMIHAKTAVIDGFWSRVGSTNLNIASWLTNCELDVLVEDRDFGRQMQEMLLADLDNATEITLNEKHRPRPQHKHKTDSPKTSSASSARFAPSAIAIGNALGSTISTSKKRYLGAAEARINLIGGVILLVTGLIAFQFPRVLAVPLGIIAIWLAVSLFIASFKLFRQAKKADTNERNRSS
jgi:cardiolipin synthase